MSTGDNTDILSRLKGYLPRGWFGDETPILDAVLAGLASVFAPIYALYLYAKAQTRISTATDGWLDLIANDFYGTSLLRKTNQSDDNYRSAILINLFRERGTRKAVSDVLTQLTGHEPIIFEPGRPADTGGYDAGGVAYDVAGGYGDILTAQAFVVAYRPAGTGIPLASGYDMPAGGYDVGQIEYIDDTMYGGPASDDDIYAAVNSVRPIGVTLWVRIDTWVPYLLVTAGDDQQLVNASGLPIAVAPNGY